MDIGKAFQFIWDDERKVPKLATGAGVILGSFILSFILVGLAGFLIVAGYTVRLLQNVRDGNPTPLPEWDQWGEDLTRGLKFFVVGVVWAAPSIIIGIVNTASGFAAGAFDGDSVGAALGLFSLLLSCLSFLYGIFLALVTPGFSLAFAEDEQIGSGLAFSEVLAWTRANIGQVVITALFTIVASIAVMIAAGIGTLVTCGIGIVVVLPLASLVLNLVRTHLYGQLGNLHPYGSGPSINNLGFEDPFDPPPPSTPPSTTDF